MEESWNQNLCTRNCVYATQCYLLSPSLHTVRLYLPFVILVIILFHYSYVKKKSLELKLKHLSQRTCELLFNRTLLVEGGEKEKLKIIEIGCF